MRDAYQEDVVEYLVVGKVADLAFKLNYKLCMLPGRMSPLPSQQ